MRPTHLLANLERSRFFDSDVERGDASLEFEWRPHSQRDEFRIQYAEPEKGWSCGWHQDETHEDLGAIHFQVDHESWNDPYREPATFDDSNPMAIFETCLNELRNRVPDLPAAVRSE
jgi:hypothetical protein